MSPIDKEQDGSIPTEEIYLELQELEGLRAAANEYAAANEPAAVESDTANMTIKARIARLRAILSDRGASVNE